MITFHFELDEGPQRLAKECCNPSLLVCPGMHSGPSALSQFSLGFGDTCTKQAVRRCHPAMLASECRRAAPGDPSTPQGVHLHPSLSPPLSSSFKAQPAFPGVFPLKVADSTILYLCYFNLISYVCQRGSRFHSSGAGNKDPLWYAQMCYS